MAKLQQVQVNQLDLKFYFSPLCFINHPQHVLYFLKSKTWILKEIFVFHRRHQACIVITCKIISQEVVQFFIYL